MVDYVIYPVSNLDWGQIPYMVNSHLWNRDFPRLFIFPRMVLHSRELTLGALFIQKLVNMETSLPKNKSGFTRLKTIAR